MQMLLSQEKARAEDDDVGDFCRWELDRDAGSINGSFMRIDDKGPIATGLDILRAKGDITILDVGCGTGRTLYNLVDQLKLRCRIPNPVIAATGISLEDFSGESHLVEVNQAYRDKELDYVVGDIQDSDLAEGTFDLIWSYEVFMYFGGTDELLAKLVRLLAPGGVLYFNTPEENQPTPYAWQELIGDSQGKLVVEACRVVERQAFGVVDSRILYKVTKIA